MQARIQQQQCQDTVCRVLPGMSVLETRLPRLQSQRQLTTDTNAQSDIIDQQDRRKNFHVLQELILIQREREHFQAVNLVLPIHIMIKLDKKDANNEEVQLIH